MARKKTPAPKTTGKKKPAVKAERPSKKNIYLDYPSEGETITSEYTFRVGTPENVKWVEVSIDKGPWQSCRSAHGYWWFDWRAEEKGKHQVIARAEKEDGQVLQSNQRKFVSKKA